jgi:phosphonoacetaldehyde methylase
MSKGKFLLLDVPSMLKDLADPARAFLPIGPLYMGTVLKQAGWDVVIYDPKISAKLTPSQGAYYFGDSLDEIAARVVAEKPDVVSISCLFTRDSDLAKDMARVVGQVAPDAILIMSGGHAAGAPLDFMQVPDVDYVVSGEGEDVIFDILKYHGNRDELKNIPGLVYRDAEGAPVWHNHRARAKDVEAVPIPDYSLVPLERYFKLQNEGFAARPFGTFKKSVSIITSRGCPFECNFCAIHLTSGRLWRWESPEKVIRHIETLVNDYGVDYIQFEDDALFTNKKRFMSIMDMMLKRGIRIGWGTPNGVRAEVLGDEEFVRKAKQTGCDYFNIAVESGSQHVLDDIVNKRLDLADVWRAARTCYKEGMQLSAYYIIGFPRETVPEIKQTLAFALELYRKYHVFPYVNYAMPMPGTDMYEEVVRDGLFDVDRPIDATGVLEATHFLGKGLIHTSEFTPDLLRTLLEQFNRGLIANMVLSAFLHPRKLMGKYVRLCLKYPYIVRRHLLPALGRKRAAARLQRRHAAGSSPAAATPRQGTPFPYDTASN